MSTPKIELKDVKKSFGSKVVLNGVSLTVNKGESLVICGGSGSGKSVTLKCILGLIHPDSGSIKIDGAEITNYGTKERDALMGKFGMLFQGGALFDSMPVWENIAFGLIQGKKMNRDQAREIACEKLRQVGLPFKQQIFFHQSFQADCKSALALRAQLQPILKLFSLMNPQQASILLWQM